MLYIYVVVIVLICVWGFAWYLLNIIAQGVIESLTTQYPGYYDASITTFTVNMWMWLGAIMLFAALIWVLVQSQKPREVVMYQ